MGQPAILVTSYVTGAAKGRNLGVAGYSYDIVTELFLPLLRRWGEVFTVARPRRDLEAKVQAVRQRGFDPIHVTFRPFQDAILARSIPNVVVPAWEFPDVPDSQFGGNPQNDWPATAERCSLVLVGGPFTQQALHRAGTRTPVRIVQVPTPREYFELPPWDPDKQTVLECSGYEYRRPPPEAPRTIPFPELVSSVRTNRTMPRPQRPSRTIDAARRTYKGLVRPILPQRLAQTISSAWRGAKEGWRRPVGRPSPRDDMTCPLELSGVVYTSILNPIDGRKNWHDLLTGFLLALGDREDATLVVKLITSDPHATRRVLNNYKLRDIPHRCKLVFIDDYLSEEQLLQLAEASTYYLQTTKAEGNCLPLMNYLAAARPGISPVHSAIGDYFDERIGYAVESHAEPSAWPHDPRMRIRTTWDRIVWTSLVDRIRKSYFAAKNDRPAYAAMADRARDRMLDWASPQSIWPRLESALDLLQTNTNNQLRAA